MESDGVSLEFILDYKLTKIRTGQRTKFMNKTNVCEIVIYKNKIINYFQIKTLIYI